MTLPQPPAVDGLILAAPAVWGWKAMNGLYATALRLAAHTVPARRLTGQGLAIRPSDNIEMLRALGRDPLVIKETRVDAVYGLVGLMDRAYEAAGRIGVPVLQSADTDQLIPARFMSTPLVRRVWRFALLHPRILSGKPSYERMRGLTDISAARRMPMAASPGKRPISRTS